jgi:uncharacterized protein (TIGR03435 family)
MNITHRLGTAVLLVAAAAFGQNPAPPLAFEVATIKVAPDLMSQLTSGKPPHIGMKIDGARVDIGAMSLSDLIRTAYKVKPYQISGPAWVAVDRYDIMAKLPDGASKDQVPEMLQTLLAERFKLTIHRDNKDHNVYALVVGKGGLKLQPSPPDTVVPPPDPDAKGGKETKNAGTTINTADGPMNIKTDNKGSTTLTGGATGNLKVTPGADGSIRYEFSKMSLAMLADTLSQLVDRPVVDMTDLKGNYQASLDIPMAELQKIARAAGLGIPGGAPGGDSSGSSPANAASDPSGGAIFDSVQKLGLKLEPRKAPIEVIVVDHLEKTPSEN